MKHFRPIAYLFIAVSAFALSACAIRGQEQPSLYDLGPARPQVNFSLPADTPPFALAGVQPSYWLDNTMIHYRLAYANDLQARSYANSRWNMPPAKLLEQRLKSRISESGGIVLRAADGAGGVLLRLELDDFSQRFDAPDRSIAQIELRVSAFRGRTLLGQKTFRQTAPAPSPNAEGGVRALADATEKLTADVLSWLAELQKKTNG